MTKIKTVAGTCCRTLLDRSFEREDRIGICMDRSATAIIISMLGIMKSGCAFVRLDPEFPKDRLAFIVVDASIQMVFCDPNYCRHGDMFHAKMKSIGTKKSTRSLHSHHLTARGQSLPYLLTESSNAYATLLRRIRAFVRDPLSTKFERR